ncbi:MAG: PGF-CTERM sorting domain-containing protein [Methanophagales archaeon]|nr:PGF-CTERM sorting domain-containing protein [Methanophagales archaeon]
MELSAGGGQTRPYNVWIRINENLVGTLTSTFPRGYYDFDINPSHFYYATAGTAENEYTLDTDMPGSYYTPLSNVGVTICLDELKLHICAESEEQAEEEIAWSAPYIHKPCDSITVNILSPEEGSSLAPLQPVLIKAEVLGDGEGEELCKVIASFNNSDTEIVLVDNGLHNDGLADDGVYANTWIPGAEVANNTNITVSACNCIANGSDNITVILNTPPTTNPVIVSNLTTTPTILWTYYDANGDPQVNYEVEVWTGPEGTGDNLWNPPIGIGTNTSLRYEGNPLREGVTYYARVRAYDGFSWGNWSETSFTIPSVSVDVYTSVNGQIDCREDLKYAIGSEVGVHANVTKDEMALLNYDVIGKITKEGITYTTFNLYDYGKATHSDGKINDGIYSAKINIPELIPGNYSLYVTAEKGSDYGEGNLTFNCTGYSAGALKVNLSVIDTIPIFKGEKVTLRVNASYPNGTACNIADVSSTVILPNFAQNKLSLEKVGDGIYETSYYLDIGGRYIIDVYGSIPIYDSVEYIGGYDEEKISVMKGNLSVSVSLNPPKEEYMKFSTVGLVGDVKCNGKPVDDVNVRAMIRKNGVSIKNITFLSTSEPGKYSGYFIPYLNGTYTLFVNASGPFYRPAYSISTFEVNETSATLKENIDSFAAESKSTLDDLTINMEKCAEAGDHFAEEVPIDRLELYSSAVLGIVGAVMGAHKLPEKEHAIKYLKEYASPSTVAKWFAAHLKEEGILIIHTEVSEEIAGKIINYALGNKSFNIYFSGMENKVNEHKDSIDTAIPDLIPSMSPETQENFTKDLDARSRGNKYQKILSDQQVNDVYIIYEQNKKEEADWLSKLLKSIGFATGKLVATYFFDGPGYYAVCVLETGHNVYDDWKELKVDERSLASAEDLAWSLLQVPDYVYLTTVYGIRQVEELDEPSTPKAVIKNIEQISKGHWVIHLIWWSWWSEDKGFFNVTIRNTGEEEAEFSVAALFRDKEGFPHLLQTMPTTKDYLHGIIIPPNEERTVKVYWLNTENNNKTDIHLVEEETDVTFILYARNQNFPEGGKLPGIYGLDTETVTFAPDRVEDRPSTGRIRTLEKSDKEGLMTIHNPIIMASSSPMKGFNYTIHIQVHNPFPNPVQAKISQKIGNVKILEHRSEILDDTIIWNRIIQPHEYAYLNYTVLPTTDPGEKVEIPEAVAEFYFAQFNETVNFSTSKSYIKAKVSILAYGGINRTLYGGEENNATLIVENFGEEIFNSHANLSLYDLNGTKVFEERYNVSVQPKSTREYSLTFCPYVEKEETYFITVETYYGNTSISALGEFVKVKVPDTILPTIANVKPGNLTAESGDLINFSCFATDAESGVESVWLNYTTDNWTTHSTKIMENPYDSLYRTNLTLPAVEVLKYKIEARDEAGNIGSSEEYTIDILLPPSPSPPPLQPDLTLASEDISFSPASQPTEGDPVTINATVHNIGGADASDFTVSFFDGAFDGASLIGTATISAAANSATTASTTWTAVAGDRTIKVVADSGGAVAESDETNNEANKTLTVKEKAVVVSPVPSYRPRRGGGGGGGGSRDTDGDGVSDVDEILAETDWKDASDYPGKAKEEAAVTPTPTPSPAPTLTPTVTPAQPTTPTAVATPTPTPTTPTPQKKVPGFEASLAVFGLLAVAYLLGRRRVHK